MARKKKEMDIYEDIQVRLIRMEDKLDIRLDSHSKRIRSLEGFRAYASGSTAVIITLAGLVFAQFTNIFK